MNELLGGKGFAESYISIPKAISWITTNHAAPLRESQILIWIIDAINNQPNNETNKCMETEEASPESSFWESLAQSLSDWWQQQREILEKDLNAWWQEQQDKITDAIDEWWQDLQRQLAEWLEQQLIEWLNQWCYGGAVLPAGLLASVWSLRRRKK